ncbi:unnamed protein product [Urochloa humidicola]
MSRRRVKAAESRPQRTQLETAVYQEEGVRCGIASNRWSAAAGEDRWHGEGETEMSSSRPVAGPLQSRPPSPTVLLQQRAFKQGLS